MPQMEIGIHFPCIIFADHLVIDLDIYISSILDEICVSQNSCYRFIKFYCGNVCIMSNAFPSY